MCQKVVSTHPLLIVAKCLLVQRFHFFRAAVCSTIEAIVNGIERIASVGFLTIGV